MDAQVVKELDRLDNFHSLYWGNPGQLPDNNYGYHR